MIEKAIRVSGWPFFMICLRVMHPTLFKASASDRDPLDPYHLG